MAADYSMDRVPFIRKDTNGAIVDAEGEPSAAAVDPYGAQYVAGGVAAAGADAGNPVKVGAKYSSTKPTYADGQRTDLQSDTRGNLAVFLNTSNGGPLSSGSPGDAQSNTTETLRFLLSRFNGTTWDRFRSKVPVVLLASAARTTTQTSADISTYNLSGIHVVLSTTTIGTGSVTVTIDGKDANGIYYNILTGAAVVTDTTNVYKVFRGATVTANVSSNDILPATIRIVVTANNANSAVYSVAYTLED